jgi:hypothetical protein
VGTGRKGLLGRVRTAIGKTAVAVQGQRGEAGPGGSSGVRGPREAAIARGILAGEVAGRNAEEKEARARAQDPGWPGRMKAMTLTLPPQVEEAARRVQALLEEAKARGLILEYSLDDFSGEPLPGVGGLAFYPKGTLEETIDPLREAFREIEDALDVGVAVILVPGEREA